MMTTDTETDFAVGLESAIRRHEAKHGRAKRIGWWQGDAAMIDALAVYRIRRSTQREVPFKQICFQRMC